MIKRYGASVSPCSTPATMSKHSVSPSGERTFTIPKETVAAIMILYRNTKVKVRSPDGDTEYFDIVAVRRLTVTQTIVKDHLFTLL